MNDKTGITKAVLDVDKIFKQRFESFIWIPHPELPPPPEVQIEQKLEKIENGLNQIRRYLETIFGSPPHYLIKGRWVSLEEIIMKEKTNE